MINDINSTESLNVPFNPLVEVTVEGIASDNSFIREDCLIKLYYDTNSLDITNSILIRENSDPNVDFNARIRSDASTVYGLYPNIVNTDIANPNPQIFNNTTILSTVGNFELQLINGLYQYPRNLNGISYNDNTRFFPTTGPIVSYDNLPLDGSGYRWVTFVINGGNINVPLYNDVDEVTFVLENSSNLTGVTTAPAGTQLLDNMVIFMKFIDTVTPGTGVNTCGYTQGGIFYPTPNGSTWFDCNKENNLLTPTVDGDGIVNGSISNTLSSKTLSFGSRSYTGRIIVRIGINNTVAGKLISFSGITII